MPRQKSARSPSQIAADRANDFAKAFYALKMVFAKYEKHLHTNADTREKYYLETRSPSYKGKPLFFGAVIRGRAFLAPDAALFRELGKLTARGFALYKRKNLL
jgi:hypothetical protein